MLEQTRQEQTRELTGTVLVIVHRKEAHSCTMLRSCSSCGAGQTDRRKKLQCRLQCSSLAEQPSGSSPAAVLLSPPSSAGCHAKWKTPCTRPPACPPARPPTHLEVASPQ